jgi:hypothetical protein
MTLGSVLDPLGGVIGSATFPHRLGQRLQSRRGHQIRIATVAATERTFTIIGGVPDLPLGDGDPALACPCTGEQPLEQRSEPGAISPPAANGGFDALTRRQSRR